MTVRLRYRASYTTRRRRSRFSKRDPTFEGDETFTLSGYTASQGEAIAAEGMASTDDGSTPTPEGDPGDDDRLSVLSISSLNVSEGSPAQFDITLTNESNTATDVVMTLSDGSANAGADYDATSVVVTYADSRTETIAVNGDGTFTVSVPANDTTFSITVQTEQDPTFEGDETFTLSGYTASQGEANAAEGTATITDDGSTPTPEGDPGDDDRLSVLSISSLNVSEGSPAQFDITLTNESNTATDVVMTLSDGSANAGADYDATSVVVTYADSRTETIAVNGDGTFTVSVPANDTTFSITVQTEQDPTFEGDETFTLSGYTASQGEANAAEGTATITDDGSTPTPEGDPGDDDRLSVLSISSLNVSEGSPAQFDITLTNESNTATDVVMTLSDGSANAGADYDATSVVVTYADSRTETIAVNGDGTFTVSVPANDTTFSITVQTEQDPTFEGDETFTLSGYTASQGEANAAEGTATITDDGSTPTPEGDPGDDDRLSVLSISSLNVSEGSPAQFDITLTNESNTATDVVMTLSDGSANAGADYDATSVVVTYADSRTETIAVNGDGTFTVSVPANDTTFSITVQTEQDPTFEGDETFTLSGYTASQGEANAAEGTATITDDGSTPTPEGDPGDDDRLSVLSISSLNVSEGSPAQFDITLTNESNTATDVVMTLSDGSANAGADYDATSVVVTYADSRTETIAVNGDGTFTVSVPANDTTFSITVQTEQDPTFEGDETFTLSGYTASQGEANAAEGTATITDDGSTPTPEGDPGDDDRLSVLSISSLNVSEGSPAQFDITLTNESNTATDVVMTLSDGSANAGADYDATSVVVTYADSRTETIAVNGDGTFTVSVPANDTTFSITVQTEQDPTFEGDETFTLSGYTASQGEANAAEGTATITDDGSTPTPEGDPGDDDRLSVLSISSLNVSEGSPAQFDITLTNESNTATDVVMTLSDGSANAGADYDATSVVVTYADSRTETIAVNGDGTFTVSVPANDTTFSITVQTEQDPTFEGDETFTLSGYTASQGEANAAEGTATITDDGSTPTPEGDPGDDDRLSVLSISSLNVSEGSPAQFDITLTNETCSW